MPSRVKGDVECLNKTVAHLMIQGCVQLLYVTSPFHSDTNRVTKWHRRTAKEIDNASATVSVSILFRATASGKLVAKSTGI